MLLPGPDQAMIESPGQVSTWSRPLNSPGPSPRPPQLSSQFPDASKTLSSSSPPFAITIRPSESFVASRTR
ncbi:MAG: hypothetical protein F4123_08570 [Gemmatimonadetes bacterium]|nr:hypothetical protein [Gemmatimonadota bacterium]